MHYCISFSLLISETILFTLSFDVFVTMYVLSTDSIFLKFLFGIHVLQACILQNRSVTGSVMLSHQSHAIG